MQSFGMPARTRHVLAVADAAEPPTRVFFGSQLIQLVEPLYAQRLKTWHDAQDIAALAEGELTDLTNTFRRKGRAMAKTIVITGASDGIGAAASRQLHDDGNHVVVVGRSPRKTQAVAQEIGVDYFLADFTKLDDVRKLAADLDRAYPRIDVLANNAGGIFGDRAKTIDGFEKTFQVNHLAPFLLTSLLLDKLIKSEAVVVQTSSSGARLFGKLDIDDLDHDRDFTPQLAYGSAKLENILFTRELHRRYNARGISAAAFHPGAVATSFATESDSFMRRIYSSRLGRAFMTTPEKGAAQMIWLAESVPGSDWVSGTYYEKRKPAKRNNPQALDADLAVQLWDRSEQLLGQKAQ
jgi:NAD(P)-dependent dehydrogenase (short-subunit alcohol dehydrogenase family)